MSGAGSQTKGTGESFSEPCRICAQEMDFIFDARILGKYQVAYGRCPRCGLIQTEAPFWLPEAYDQAISADDVGLVRRNLELCSRTQDIILAHFDPSRCFLDFAGGYGLLVRLMRDAGFDFHRHDPFCANIFATGFDIPELQVEHRFELITAFELLEHLQEPAAAMRKLLEHTDSLLVSTRLQPPKRFESVDDWWYFCPQTGQHITFYTTAALQCLAEQTDTTLHTDNSALHMFTRRAFPLNPLLKSRSLLRKAERMLCRWRTSLRKRIFPTPPPASLLPRDAERMAGNSERQVEDDPS